LLNVFTIQAERIPIAMVGIILEVTAVRIEAAIIAIREPVIITVDIGDKQDNKNII
jgi:hypothetical protein